MVPFIKDLWQIINNFLKIKIQDSNTGKGEDNKAYQNDNKNINI